MNWPGLLMVLAETYSSWEVLSYKQPFGNKMLYYPMLQTYTLILATELHFDCGHLSFKRLRVL